MGNDLGFIPDDNQDSNPSSLLDSSLEKNDVGFIADEDQSDPLPEVGLPPSLDKSFVAKDIVPELKSRGDQGFDDAVQVSGGDLYWSLKAFKDVTPDAAAKVHRIARSGGVPFDLVNSDPKTFEEWDQAKKIYESLSELNQDGQPKYPNTVKWLKDPVNMAKGKESVEALKNLELVIQKRKPITFGNKVGNIAAKGLTGLSGIASGLLKSVDEARRIIDGPTPFEHMQKNLAFLRAKENGATDEEADKISRDTANIKDAPFYQAGQLLEDITTSLAPGDPRLNDSFLYSTLPSATGSMIGFLGGGVTSKLLSLPGYAFPLVGGALTQAAQAWDEADKAGASEEDKTNAFLLNLPLGATEAIPLGKMIDRIGTKAGLDFKKKLMAALREGGENTVQEVFQQVGGNAVAKELYDEDRAYWDSAVESGAAGGITGFFASLIISAATGQKVKVPTPLKQEQPSVEEQQVAIASFNERQEINLEIGKTQAQFETLEELKKAVDAIPISATQPETVQEIIEKQFPEAESGKVTVVDSNAIKDVFFQGATTPEAQAKAQADLDIFTQDAGITTEEWNSAIASGTSIQVALAPLVTKYGNSPVFKAVSNDLANQHKEAKERLQSNLKAYQADLDLVRKENEIPSEFTKMREAMMRPKEEGGQGLSAKQADANLVIAQKMFRNLGSQTGESLMQTLERTGFQLKVGDDAKIYLQNIPPKTSAGSEISDLYPKVTLDKWKKAIEIIEQRPGFDEDQDLSPVELSEHQSKFVENEIQMPPEEIVQLEREARASMQADLNNELEKVRIPFRHAIKKAGGILSLSKLKETNDPLHGDMKAAFANKKPAPGIVRNDAPPLDILRSNLEGYGYRFETVTDLIEVISEWLRTGKDPEWHGFRDDIQYQSETPKEEQGDALAKVPQPAMESLRKLKAQSAFDAFKESGRKAKDNTKSMFDEGGQQELFQSGVDQTQTPEFKKWFGDSKVVDENGKPLVVYHGTGNAAELKAFSHDFIGKGNDQFGSGFYFTNKPETASGYTSRRLDPVTQKLGGEESPGVLPVFLSIRNPIELKGNQLIRDVLTNLTSKQVKDIIKRSPELKDPDGPLSNFGDVRHEGFSAVLKNAIATYQGGDLLALANDIFPGQAPAFLHAVKDVLGYDGVITTFDTGEKHFVAWFPEQIKSSIGNKGTFDPNNPNILYQDSPVKETFRSNLLKYQHGSLPAGTKLSFGLPSEALKLGGVPNSNITITQDVLNKATTDKHKIPIHALMKLPEALADPIFIFKSKKEPDARTVLTEIKRPEGNLLAALHFKEGAGGTELVEVASVHQRPVDQIQNWINEGLATYYNKEKSRSWLSQELSGVQFPAAWSQLTATKDIRSNSDLSQTQFQGGQSNRAFYHFNPDTGKHVIGLLEKADSSSFLHEMYHLWQQEVSNMIEAGVASEQLQKDYRDLLDWAGVEEGKKPTRDQNEKLAKAFETYLMEGKAPTTDLIDVFGRLKKWLIGIYKSVQGLGVEINDDIRGIFDRIIATQQEIDEERNRYSLQKSIEDLIDTDESEKNKVRIVRNKNQQSEEDKLVAKRLGAYQRSQEGKEQIEKEVKKAVNDDPFYLAIESAEKEKIPLSLVSDQYGEINAKFLADKFPEMFSEDGQETLDSIAIAHGFESPQDFITALKSRPTRGQIVNQKTKEILARKEIELRGDVASMTEEIHSDASLTTMIAEQQLLADEVSKRNRGKKLSESQRPERLKKKAYEEAAKSKLAQMPVSKATDYSRHAKAEQKSAAKQIKLLQEGNLEEALKEGMRRTFHHSMIVESVKLRERMARDLNNLSWQKVKLALENMEDAYRKPFIEVLSRYGLSNKKNDAEYNLNGIKAFNEDLDALMPDFIRNREGVGKYQDLTVDQFDQLIGFLNAIKGMGRDKMFSMQEEKEKKWAELREKQLTNIEALDDKKVPQDRDLLVWIKNKIGSLVDSNYFPVFIFKILDLHKPKNQAIGPNERMFSMMVDANTAQTSMMRAWYNKHQKSFTVFQDAMLRIKEKRGFKFDLEGVPLPERAKLFGDTSWTVEKVVMTLLNLGNAQNRVLVEDGLGLNQVQIDKLSSMFTAQELEHLQKLWDGISELYPDLDKEHFDITNNHLRKVEAVPVELIALDGTRVKLKGGYFPISYDKRYDKRLEGIEEENLLRKKAVLRQVKPEDGMTISRGQTLQLPPKLSMSVINSHLSDVTRYITHAKVLLDVNRMLNDNAWADAVERKIGVRALQNLKDWASHNANPDTPIMNDGASNFTKFLEFNRKLSIYKMLGFKVTSAVVQKLGLISAGSQIGWRYMLKASKDLGLNGNATQLGFMTKAYEEMRKESKLIEGREEQLDFNQTEVMKSWKPIRRLGIKIGDARYTSDDLRNWAFAMMRWSDRGVVLQTYRAAKLKYAAEFYDNAKTPQENDKEAIRYAESMVIKTQPTGLAADTNWIQRSKNPIVRSFIMVQSWAFKAGAMQTAEYRAWKEGAITGLQYMNFLAQNIIVMGIAEEILRSVIRWEEPEYIDILINWLSPIAGWVPFLRDAAYPIIKKGNFVGAVREQQSFLAAQEVLKAPASIKRALQDKIDTTDAIIQTAKSIGVATGVPVGNLVDDIRKTIENVEKDQEED